MWLAKIFGRPGLNGPASAPLPRPGGSGFSGSRSAYLLASLAVLAPCFWQARIHAGDLSSHIYNSWLAELAQAGKTPGLAVFPQTTNVLFDLILSALFRGFGAAIAQRVAVSLAVLVFVWGAFAFIAAVAGRRPWHVFPCIAMFAYGFVFHMGFFNFYLSLGLCFWAMAFIWQGGRRRIAAGCGALVVAYTAHALPVAWCCGLLACLWVMRKTSPLLRVVVTAASVASLWAVRVLIMSSLSNRQTNGQIFGMSGVDQLWVFGPRYLALSIALLLLWSLLLTRLAQQSSARSALTGIPLQMCIVTAAALALVPSSISLPGYLHSLDFIAERMSLPLAICICAVTAQARPGVFERAASILLAAVFFVFLFQDHWSLNQIENGVERAVLKVEPRQRVVSRLRLKGYRANTLAHMIDRACIGHCYSYANYEPSTWQFRIRALERNPYVINRYADSWALQAGTYRVKESDLPLYAIEADESGRITTRELKAGELCGSTLLKALPELSPAS